MNRIPSRLANVPVQVPVISIFFTGEGVLFGVGVLCGVALGVALTEGLGVALLIFSLPDCLAVELLLPNHLLQPNPITNPTITARDTRMLTISQRLLLRFIEEELCPASCINNG